MKRDPLPPMQALTFGILLLLAARPVLQAQFAYETNRDGTIGIAGYTGLGGEVSVPPAIHGRPVTAISCWAFQECKVLKNITLPQSITSIGTGAFYGCSELKRVTIPEGVTCIPAYAFQDCTSLISISIPGSVTVIEGYALYGCVSLVEGQTVEKGSRSPCRPRYRARKMSSR